MSHIKSSFSDFLASFKYKWLFVHFFSQTITCYVLVIKKIYFLKGAAFCWLPCWSLQLGYLWLAFSRWLQLGNGRLVMKHVEFVECLSKPVVLNAKRRVMNALWYCFIQNNGKSEVQEREISTGWKLNNIALKVCGKDNVIGSTRGGFQSTLQNNSISAS